MITCKYCMQNNNDEGLECRRCGAPLPEKQREPPVVFVKVSEERARQAVVDSVTYTDICFDWWR